MEYIALPLLGLAFCWLRERQREDWLDDLETEVRWEADNLK